MPSVNPDILRWARETAGLSLEEAVEKLGINAARGVEPVERLEMMEAGEVAPTRPMLVKMSKQYRRPLLSFYLSAPPRQGDRGQDFRTLPAAFAMSDNALVDAVVRDIRARQSLVRATLEEEDEAETLPFIGTARTTEQPRVLARRIAETIEFDLGDYRRCRTIGDAVAYLRSQIEAAGIFVLFVDNLGSHHTEMPVDVFRGFALADDVAPFVAVNANDSKGAQSFTMIHELAHLWLGLTGLSGRDGERDIEKFCNDVAGEFLLPALELQQLDISEANGITDAVQTIGEFAQARKISGTMVAYKLHRSGAFNFAFYQGIAGTFRQNFLSQRGRDREVAREAESGPTYPVIRRHRAGPALVQLVDRMLGAGALTTTKAGKVLGVSAKNVQSVLQAGGPRLSA
ncbi:XRE family transcriptional regulator [uncultured Tateyamaria sp.]|uniref:ImmA/IrrE family metallo-endopeptidase n=1 Tax=uncultured Tateyamaria sp. TaxID=455651 RepID=UPI0026090270|nr:XRE family transcriptional regulator [uncultured Tateyamaria sp.]